MTNTLIRVAAATALGCILALPAHAQSAAPGKPPATAPAMSPAPAMNPAGHEPGSLDGAGYANSGRCENDCQRTSESLQRRVENRQSRARREVAAILEQVQRPPQGQERLVQAARGGRDAARAFSSKQFTVQRAFLNPLWLWS